MDTSEAVAPRVARRRLVVAVVVVAAAWIPAGLAIALSIAYALPIVAADEFLSLYLVDAVVWGGVSGLLLARRPNPVGVIAAATAIGSGLSALSRQLVRSPWGGWIDEGFAAHVLDRLWLPGTLVAVGILPLLLTSRPLGPKVRALIAVGLVAAALVVPVSFLRQRPQTPANPFAVDVPAVQDTVVAIFTVALSVSVAVGIATLGVLIWRRWWGPADDRRGTGWLILGQAALLALFGPTFLPWLPTIAHELFLHVPFAPFAALLFMVAAVVVVSLGNRLWGIEATVNRVVVDGLLLTVIALVVVSFSLPLAKALPVPPTVATLAGVVGVALALGPLRRALQRRVDALVYGDAADPVQLLARLGAERHATDLLENLVDELRDALRLAVVEVRAVDDGRVPDPVGRGDLVLPLRGADGVVGWVRAVARGRQRVDPRTRRVLEDISGVLAVALQFDAVHRELDEAQVRALSVGEEERRMLRHELRDGLAPALAGAAERLVGAAAALPGGAVRPELEAVRADVARATTDVRDLARTLLPGALDAGDLDAALHELAARFSGDRLEIVVRASRVADLGVTHQNAVHHLAAEAVLLLRRTPTAQQAELVVDVDDDRAVIELVADRPFARGATATATLGSIADRARELGGSSRVAGGGTRIRVEVPR